MLILAGAEEVAEDYRLQVQVYTDAARVKGPVRMRLHFTYPNEVVEG